MTADTSKLIEGLRPSTYVADPYSVMAQAANVLEAQAAEIEELREFYDAVTARSSAGDTPYGFFDACHSYGCAATGSGKKLGKCDCGGQALRDRMDRVYAKLKGSEK